MTGPSIFGGQALAYVRTALPPSAPGLAPHTTSVPAIWLAIDSLLFLNVSRSMLRCEESLIAQSCCACCRSGLFLDLLCLRAPSPTSDVRENASQTKSFIFWFIVQVGSMGGEPAPPGAPSASSGAVPGSRSSASGRPTVIKKPGFNLNLPGARTPKILRQETDVQMRTRGLEMGGC